MTNYISNNWGILIVLIALTIMLHSDIHLERRMVRQIGITDGLLLIYSISTYIETYLGNRSVYSLWRPIFSAIDYSMTSLIFISVIMIVYPQRKTYLYIPWAVNTFSCFISIPTGLVFNISKENHFSRGTFGFLPFIINIMYLLFLMFCIFRYRKWDKNEYVILGFMFFTAVSCVFMPLYFDAQSDQWLMITIAFDMLVYYVFLLQQFTSRDSLTGLLNRQCYYADLKKLGSDISALIAIDMNGLKEINDGMGHSEGDKALKEIAQCFEKAVDQRYHIYRIGGDEFTIICTRANEFKVEALIIHIEKELKKHNYSCAVGYAMNSKDMSIDELYYKADAMLYEKKEEYYTVSGKKRRKRK
ncbi:MAG: GGDEF domain-containing protein [Ruminococcus sp.]|nr:GGDEF domain-containing protein [Ruminococcus sp.]